MKRPRDHGRKAGAQLAEEGRYGRGTVERPENVQLFEYLACKRRAKRPCSVWLQKAEAGLRDGPALNGQHCVAKSTVCGVKLLGLSPRIGAS